MWVINAINRFFLGEVDEVSASDMLWFYGFYVVILLILITVIGGIR